MRLSCHRKGRVSAPSPILCMPTQQSPASYLPPEATQCSTPLPWQTPQQQQRFQTLNPTKQPSEASIPFIKQTLSSSSNFPSLARPSCVKQRLPFLIMPRCRLIAVWRRTTSSSRPTPLLLPCPLAEPHLGCPLSGEVLSVQECSHCWLTAPGLSLA